MVRAEYVPWPDGEAVSVLALSSRFDGRADGVLISPHQHRFSTRSVESF